jgi:hypothetical protein
MTAVMEGLHARISNLEMLNAKIRAAKPKRRPEKITQNMINLKKLRENSPELYELYQAFNKRNLGSIKLKQRYNIDGDWAIDEFSKTSVFGFGCINEDELGFSITPHVDSFGVDDMLSSIKGVDGKTKSDNVFKVDDLVTSIDDIDNTDGGSRNSGVFELQIFNDPDYTTLAKTKYVSTMHDIKKELNNIFKWSEKLKKIMDGAADTADSKMQLDEDEDKDEDDELLRQFQGSASIRNPIPHDQISLLDFLTRRS